MLNFSTDLDSTFLALADASRRGIIERLVQGPASVSDLAKPLPMSLPAVMQHIAILEGVGLIRTEKIGRTRTCRLEPDRLAQIEAWINDQRQAWNARLDRLALYLETQQAEDISRGSTSADGT